MRKRVLIPIIIGVVVVSVLIGIPLLQGYNKGQMYNQWSLQLDGEIYDFKNENVMKTECLFHGQLYVILDNHICKSRVIL